ncbi:MAG: EamA family transporter [Treponema sp.]|nr:EamA family transporter [Treponema sp.]
MIFYIIILFCSVIISAFSQILLKKAALKNYSSPIREYLNLLVISGYGIFFLAVLLDMIGLKKVPVSFIPVIESSSYLFVLLFSRIFLKEKINSKKFFAVCIILCGIIIYIL